MPKVHHEATIVAKLNSICTIFQLCSGFGRVQCSAPSERVNGRPIGHAKTFSSQPLLQHIIEHQPVGHRPLKQSDRATRLPSHTQHLHACRTERPWSLVSPSRLNHSQHSPTATTVHIFCSGGRLFARQRAPPRVPKPGQNSKNGRETACARLAHALRAL